MENLKNALAEVVRCAEKNATWWIIAGLLLVALLIFIGLFVVSHRAKKQDKVLENIHAQLGQVQQTCQESAQVLRQGVLTLEQIREDQLPPPEVLEEEESLTPEEAYEEAMEAFFQLTEPQEVEMPEEEEVVQTPSSADEAPLEDQSGQTEQETFLASPVAEETQKTDGAPGEEEALLEPLKREKTRDKGSLYDTGRSGKKYSREELETQIQE